MWRPTRRPWPLSAARWRNDNDPARSRRKGGFETEEGMTDIKVDARGKLCPVPLVMTKKEFDRLEEGQRMFTLVDNDTSAQNVRTFVLESGGRAEMNKEGNVTTLTITKGARKTSGEAEGYCRVDAPDAPHVIYVSRSRIGNGEPEELGRGLMQAFLQTIKDVRPLPSHVIFMHNGVTLLETGSKTAEAAMELEKLGVTVVACGTCLDYLGLMDRRACGKVSNMYDILTLLTTAGRVVAP